MPSVPGIRIRALNQKPVEPSRDFVLYWMIAARRATWNAALQRALERGAAAGCGATGGYLRMLWGKKILEWSPSPRDALQTMIAIMNRWSLDGPDPNSYADDAWTLGRYDRPWPEREIFGKVRAMSSASTARKVRLRGYLEHYGDHS